MFNAFVITCSDKGYRNERIDTSGEAIKDHLLALGFTVLDKVIISDDIDQIEETLLYAADTLNADVIITTGGTGFSPRDNTPEATKRVIKKEVPGISEMLRYESYKLTKKAYLSRGVSGIRNRTLIINLPGSLKAVTECLSFLDNVFSHGLKVLTLLDRDCGE